ncbi:hypothetical protein EQ718_10965 [Paracoccus versutus]|uniref:Uncharacterized protein n=1 Tax=Paracoccus versutus TaxID=34007 RepID=A0A3D9XU50_PARVE|nr:MULTISPECIES: hypothetical protein [Paracoccus]WGR59748.1 hypothetical protein E3U26_03015 [Paracoccus ferrooxidans]SFY22618.1 hypothetical protein SAMN04244548_03149 [Paracoccus pantotrophus]MBT0778527.1 hypothetical protein [Paracoccus sp. pheM1]REF70459.1 hypothetical protein BDD41_3197 [Paracoccus versutus]REG54166.1 hypothetical protein ATH84_1005134 [Paracoccus versutus]
MPQLVRLYIVSIAIGFALALAFTALLLALDVGTLRHLVTATRGGWIAVLMLVVFHTILFSGVQFGIRIMLMARKDGRGGGLRQRIRPNPAPAMAPAATRPR